MGNNIKVNYDPYADNIKSMLDLRKEKTDKYRPNFNVIASSSSNKKLLVNMSMIQNKSNHLLYQYTNE